MHGKRIVRDIKEKSQIQRKRKRKREKPSLPPQLPKTREFFQSQEED
jgi:hypothetical protein